MSRRQLTLALAAVASLAVTACGANPTAPTATLHAPAANADAAPSGWIGSSG